MTDKFELSRIPWRAQKGQGHIIRTCDYCSTSTTVDSNKHSKNGGIIPNGFLSGKHICKDCFFNHHFSVK